MIKVAALTFNVESLFGRQAQLNLGVGVSAKGYNTCAAAPAGEESADLLTALPARHKNNIETDVGY